MNWCINSTVNSTGSVCNYGDVRLVNGDNQYEGRVEVCISNGWQTVCDNGWDSNDARVICNQLGFAYSGCKQVLYEGTALCDCYMSVVY